MTSRMAWAALLILPVAGRAQYVVYSPMQPVFVAPAWTPVASSPVSIPIQPIAPAKPSTRVERYYFQADAEQRPLAPPDSTQLARLDLASPRPGVIIREYYYIAPADPVGKPMAAVPKEILDKKPPKPLNIPDPVEALKSKNKPEESKTELKIPLASTDPGAGAPSDRQYLQPMPDFSKRLKVGGKAIAPLRISGILRATRGGGLLKGMKIDFIHADQQFADRTSLTDTMARFETALEPGRWLVYALEAPGGRRFLKTIVVEIGENTTVQIDG